MPQLTIARELLATYAKKTLPLLFASTSCFAHGFGEQLQLEIPLWLWLGGAALTVLLSFAVVIDFLPKNLQTSRYAEIDLSDKQPVTLLLNPKVLWCFRLLLLAILFLTVVAGLLGNQQPDKNIAPAMIWILFWVGLTFAVTIFGDFWRLLNPFATLYTLVFRRREAVHSSHREISATVIVLLFGGFMYAEHLWPSSDSPRLLGLAVVSYIVLTLTAMHRLGPSNWLRRGEIFTLIFSTFARFSPIKFTLDTKSSVKLTLRPPAIALIEDIPSPTTLTALIIMLLAGVTFDGWIETASWQHLSLRAALIFGDTTNLKPALLAVNFLAMCFTPLVFFALFWLACKATQRLLNVQANTSAWELMRYYVTSLIPIAIAYHFAHYAMLLLIDGQALIALLSDPFGWGWNLLGTAHYNVDKTLFSATTIWYFVVFMIVGGHMLSVYLAHLVTLSLTASKSVAVKAGTPILLLMVFYTVISLWVIAQPAIQT